MTVRRWLFALAGAGVLLLPVGIPTRAATIHQIEIVDFAFSPATVTIIAGDTVTWTNSDAVAHTATGSGFDSGLLDQGESYSLTFTAAGTYDYLCTPHPTMTGQVVVQAAAPAATPGAVPNVAMERPTPSGWWIEWLALAVMIASLLVFSAPRPIRAVTGRRR